MNEQLIEDLKEKLNQIKEELKFKPINHSIEKPLCRGEVEYLLEALTSIEPEKERLILDAMEEGVDESLDTSVKSESAEEVLTNVFDKSEIRPRYKEDDENVVYYHENIVIQAMHDFANNSGAMKENAIGFFKSQLNEEDWDDERDSKAYDIYLTNKEK